MWERDVLKGSEGGHPPGRQGCRGACSEAEIDKTIEELKDQLMDYVGMAAREDGGEFSWSHLL